MKITLLTLLVLVSSHGAFAVHGDYAEAMRVRRLIEVSDPGRREGAQKIVLPVSRGFHQKGTQLCWAYASLSMLESNYLARHPESKLELSRRAMQFITMKDRYTRQVHGTENFISERGIAMDAMALIRDAGLVAFADYKDIADPYGAFSFATQLSAAVTLADKYATIARGLEAVYGDPPLLTHLDEQEVTRGELVKEVVGNQIWQSFAVGKDGEEKFGKHPDPDGRGGAIAYYMPREKFAARIKASLEAQHALEVTLGGHSILLYGAEYDEDGTPVKYYMKDSYPGFFYESVPTQLHGRLIEVTTAL